MSRWIYVFSPNDWGHLEATARWSKICIGVELSCSGEKAKGNLGRMPKAGGESIHPPCSLIHLAELSQSPPSHEGWYYPQWRERGRIEGRRKEKRAEQRCQKKTGSLPGILFLVRELEKQKSNSVYKKSQASLSFFKKNLLTVWTWWDATIWQKCRDLLVSLAICLLLQYSMSGVCGQRCVLDIG